MYYNNTNMKLVAHIVMNRQLWLDNWAMSWKR